MNLISDNLKQLLWDQISHEKFNANLYLFIAAHLKNLGLDNLAKHFESQHGEETEHAMQIYGLLTDLDTPVSIKEIESPDFTIVTMMDIANAYLSREILTTENLAEIKQVAIQEGNPVVEEHMRKMIAQQQHEYEEATTFMDKIELLSNDWKFIALYDASLG